MVKMENFPTNLTKVRLKIYSTDNLLNQKTIRREKGPKTRKNHLKTWLKVEKIEIEFSSLTNIVPNKN